MKKYTKTLLLLVAAVAVIAVSCKKDAKDAGTRKLEANAAFLKPTAVIPTNANGTISSNLTLTNDKTWLIDGIIYLTNGAVLTIQPGTTLVSGAFKTYTDQTGATRQIRGVIVATKGTQINAIGTADQPIVFTSPNDVCNRAPGDLGGVILLGDAPTNKATSTVIEGLPANPPADITYGGTDATDNSGTLKYVRIEFAGFRLFADNEINGLTLGGVGSGTTLDHIQVSYSADDSFEFFGGTVNATYLLSLACDDDDYDFDQGYRGAITRAIALKDPNSTHSQSGTPALADANGIESDNDATGSTATPQTRPNLQNLTIIGYCCDSAQSGRELKFGTRFRRNSSFSLQSSIVAGFPVIASFEGMVTAPSAPGTWANNWGHADSVLYTPGTGIPSWIVASTSLLTPACFNDTLKLGTGGLTPCFSGNGCTPNTYSFSNLLPRTGSPVLSTGAGAVSTATLSNWSSGNWANFNPQSTVY